MVVDADRFGFSEVRLEEQQFHVSSSVSEELFAHSPEITRELDAMTRTYLYRALARVATQRLDRVGVDYPASWWQHTKLVAYGWRVRGRSVVPGRVRRRWPPRMREYRVDPLVLYPQVALPRERHVVYIPNFSGGPGVSPASSPVAPPTGGLRVESSPPWYLLP